MFVLPGGRFGLFYIKEHGKAVDDADVDGMINRIDLESRISDLIERIHSISNWTPFLGPRTVT